MSNPFTQAASQGYEDEPEGPASPEPEEEEVETPSSPPIFAQNSDLEEEEEEEEKPKSSRRRVQIQNDSDNDDEEANEEKVQPKDFLEEFSMKKRRNDDESVEKQTKRSREEEPEAANSDVEDVVENIFGNDVDDLEDGNDQEEVVAELQDLQTTEADETFNDEVDEDSSDQPKDEETTDRRNDTLDEIDIFLNKKAEQRRGNRRRGKNGDTDLSGPDADRLVKRLLDRMKTAAEEDRIFNENRQPATAKLLLLPLLEQHLCRADLTDYFLENGLLSVFKEWLTPLPDNSLPNIKIRDSLIRLLQQFGSVDTEHLRSSGIGKSLMYLYKHPRESKENKLKLIKIIHDWARPIFNLTTDYKVLSREDRERRDADQASLKRQTSQSGKNKSRSADVDLPFVSKNDEANQDDDCPRARVPRPSNKDYVHRPRSTVDISEKKGDSKRKTISRLDEIKRRQQDQKRQSKPMSIVKLSVEGNRMHI